MGTVKCRDCGNEVSTKADKCPHCGRPRKKSSRLGGLLLILLFVIILAHYLPGDSSKTSTKPQISPAATTAPLTTSSPPPAAPPPPNQRALDKQYAISAAIMNYKWRKSAGGNVMQADFTILNQSDNAIKDVKITCTHYAKSGTKIDSNTRTIYEIFPAKKSKTVKDFNMGFIHSQANSTSCEIVDLELY